MKQRKIRISKTSTMHFVKLLLRSVLFIGATILYLITRINKTDGVFGGYEKMPCLLALIWTVYTVEMAFRFFPSRIESPGCQKQFAKNYKPTGEKISKLQSWKRTFSVAFVWLILNGIVGVLYYTHIIDAGILILISLGYGVCDMICILFFCPFQTWFMKNRCCTDCRIYNWDFAMMFTPLIFIPHWYTWSLLILSLMLLIRWEVTLRRHPERFSERTNACISCKNCTEKLCKHKRQLQQFIRDRKFIIKK